MLDHEVTVAESSTVLEHKQQSWSILCTCIFTSNYCKTLNVCVPFISRISPAKQNREIGEHKHRYYTNFNWQLALCVRWKCVV